MKNKLNRDDVVDLIVFLDFLRMDLSEARDTDKMISLQKKLAEMRNS